MTGHRRTSNSHAGTFGNCFSKGGLGKMYLSLKGKMADEKEKRGEGNETFYNGYHRNDPLHAAIPAGWGIETETNEILGWSVPFENTEWNRTSGWT